MSSKGFLSSAETAEAVDGRLIPYLNTSPEERNIASVSIDSRNAAAGSLFFALKGENRDGHDFIPDAIARGAVCIVAEKESEEVKEIGGSCSCSFVIVENSLKALQKLAGYYRSLFHDITIVGITGSSGKTTTKEMTASILEKEAPTVMNEGNLNSETGLPLSVFKINSTHRYGVFEMGISRPGEMDDLVRILNPDYAVLTNIGTAHIGFMGTKDAIAAEKSKIFSSGNLKKGIVWEEDSYAEMIRKKAGSRVELYGVNSTENLLSVNDKGLEGAVLSFREGDIRLPLIGKFNCINALAAVRVAGCFNIDFEKIKEGLQGVKPLFGRGQITTGSVTIINDCYNSNLESASAALQFLENLSWGGRKTAVLGSVLETGEDEELIHTGIFKKALSSSLDAVFLFGKEYSTAWKTFRRENPSQTVTGSGTGPLCFWSDSFEAMVRNLTGFLSQGDIVLLKGSRGIALERFIGPIENIHRKVINC